MIELDCYDFRPCVLCDVGKVVAMDYLQVFIDA